jgi:hypothetical protein
MNHYESYKQNQNDAIKPNMSHDEYFEKYHELAHRFYTFKKMFRYLDNISSPLIVETGISRKINSYTGDGHSTLLFDEYLHFFKKSGMLISIDIDQKTCDFTAPLLNDKSTIICSDSVIALNFISKNSDLSTIDLLYLDSYDVDWENPHPSALHHFKELLAIQPKLKPGTLIVVDDHVQGRGKGKYIAEYMTHINKVPYFDEYQIGWIW